jgi:hypothetical protein
MARTSIDVENALVELEHASTPSAIAQRAPLLLEELCRYSGMVLHPQHDLDHVLLLHKLVGILARAEPDELARVMAAKLGTDRDASDRVMAAVAYPNPAADVVIAAPIKTALAAATAAPSDDGWRFPRLFWPVAWVTAPSLHHNIDLAIAELFETSDLARRGSGLVRFLDEVVQTLTTRDADLESIVRSAIEGVLAPLEQCSAVVADETALAWFSRVFDMLRTLDIARDVVSDLHALCRNVAVANPAIEHVLAGAPSTRAKPPVKILLFRLYERAQRPDDMATSSPDRKNVDYTLATAAAFEATGRVGDAIAYLRKLKPSARRDEALERLLRASGDSAASLAHLHIEPENVERLAREHAVPVAELISRGASQAKDKGSWIELALRRGELEEARRLADEAFHPDQLPRLLAAHPDLPPALACKLAVRAVEQVLAPSTEWRDAAEAQRTAILAARTALERAASDAERDKLRASFRKKIDRITKKSTSHFHRELAFTVDETLGAPDGS